MDFEEVIKNLKPNIEKIANKYYISGFEKEDIYQECFIGVLSAMKYFDSSKNNNFYAFANLTIERRIIMLLKKSKRQKNISLSKSVSLDNKVNNNVDLTYLDFLKSDINQIEELKNKEILDEKKEKLNKHLSKMEKEVFNLYFKGYSYKKIAKEIGKTEKAVDNALQRIKSKTKRIKN